MGARLTWLRESGSGVLDVLTGEGERFMAQRLCPNMNHRRRDSPVAFCPNCGEVVNPGIPPRSCSEESHAKQRREETTIAWIVGSSSSVKGDEPRGARRDAAAVTAPTRADGKKRSRGIRSRGAGVKACHHTGRRASAVRVSVPPVGLPLGRADRPLHPLVPLRSYASPRKGRTGTRLRVVRSQRAAEALPGARGVSASPRLIVCAKS